MSTCIYSIVKGVVPKTCNRGRCVKSNTQKSLRTLKIAYLKIRNAHDKLYATIGKEGVNHGQTEENKHLVRV